MGKFDEQKKFPGETMYEGKDGVQQTRRVYDLTAKWFVADAKGYFPSSHGSFPRQLNKNTCRRFEQ